MVSMSACFWYTFMFYCNLAQMDLYQNAMRKLQSHSIIIIEKIIQINRVCHKNLHQKSFFSWCFKAGKCYSWDISNTALKRGIHNTSETHCIPSSIPQTDQETVTVVSPGYISTEKPTRYKVQWRQSGICEMPDSLRIATKIIYEHKQMWSKNIKHERLSVSCRRDRNVPAIVENKASVLTTTLHLCRSDWETGSGVGTHKTQTEITTVALMRHTDQFKATFGLHFCEGRCCFPFIIVLSVFDISWPLNLIANRYLQKTQHWFG